MLFSKKLSEFEKVKTREIAFKLAKQYHEKSHYYAEDVLILSENIFIYLTDNFNIYKSKYEECAQKYNDLLLENSKLIQQLESK